MTDVTGEATTTIRVPSPANAVAWIPPSHGFPHGWETDNCDALGEPGEIPVLWDDDEHGWVAEVPADAVAPLAVVMSLATRLAAVEDELYVLRERLGVTAALLSRDALVDAAVASDTRIHVPGCSAPRFPEHDRVEL